MHPLLGVFSVLLVMLAGYVALGLLRRMSGWSYRRDLQFVVLGAPVISLALALGGLQHFTGRSCFIGAPPWDHRLGVALPLWMGLIALGGLVVGLARLLLMYWVMARRSILAGDDLLMLANRLSHRLGVPRPRLRVCVSGCPLALTYGLLRPTVLLSTGMLEHLDGPELESVLAHELGHVARRDYLVIVLATMLRDAFFYLPTSWEAYRQLQREKELACDDLAVGVTRRPLVLASALAKVWQQSLGSSRLSLAQPLTTAAETIEDRIGRLMDGWEPAERASYSRLMALAVGGLALGALLALQGVNVVFMLAPMGCGPSSPLHKLF